MKKQIILVLSFLIIILCLTGCANEKTISGEKVDEITEIANNVVNQNGYVLPEGYTVTYPDNTTNARITITDNTNLPSEYYEIVFDVSQEEIHLFEISIVSQKNMNPSTFPIILLIIIIILFVILGIVIVLISTKFVDDKRKK